jgi:hypothetical protein
MTTLVFNSFGKNSDGRKRSNSYDSDIYEKIAAIIGVSPSKYWKITDSIKDLYIIHYTDEVEDTNPDFEKLINLRGIVVDVKMEKIYCNSFGYTPTMTADIIPIENDNIIFTDEFDKKYTLDTNNSQFKRGIEGSILRAIFYDGDMYLLTHKRLNTQKSTWGNSVTFHEMYNQLGGPDPKELFDTSKKYSPYCHFFIVVHPDLVYNTKDKVTKGYLAYCGCKKMWEDSCYTEIDNIIHTPKMECSHPNGENKLFDTPYISLYEANQFLRYGNYEPFDDENVDDRLKLGEFIIIYSNDKLYKIQSKACEWRIAMRDNNPNLLQQFFKLMDNANFFFTNSYNKKIKGKVNDFLQRYPTLSKYDLSDIQKKVKDEGISVWPNDDQVTDLKTVEDRMLNIFYCFLMSVSPHRQRDVVTFYNKYKKAKITVTNFIIKHKNDLYKLADLTDKKELPRRFGQIVSTAKKNGDNIDKNIKNLVDKEFGDSLYFLLKWIQNLK